MIESTYLISLEITGAVMQGYAAGLNTTEIYRLVNNANKEDKKREAAKEQTKENDHD